MRATAAADRLRSHGGAGLPGSVDGRLPTAIFTTHTHLDHSGGLRTCSTGWPANPTLRPVRLSGTDHRATQQQLAEDPCQTGGRGMNFWDRFQLVPVGAHFWHVGLLFDVFAVSHHGYRAAFGLRHAGRFVHTGDTRPIPEVLARFAANGEVVFHDCALHANPSHTGSADLAKCYSQDCGIAWCRITTSHRKRSGHVARAQGIPRRRARRLLRPGVRRFGRRSLRRVV